MQDKISCVLFSETRNELMPTQPLQTGSTRPLTTEVAMKKISARNCEGLDGVSGNVITLATRVRIYSRATFLPDVTNLV